MFKSLEEKQSAVDEKLKVLEARIESRWAKILPNYFMVFLTFGIAVFTGLLMWYLSRGTTDKTLTEIEEVIQNGFKTFNDFLSMYLRISKERTRKEDDLSWIFYHAHRKWSERFSNESNHG
jgi:hypothetical protein